MTTRFKVLHYDCASCALVMEGIMEDTPGVSKAEVNAVTKVLIVEHDEGNNPAGLKSILDEEGYPVELVSL